MDLFHFRPLIQPFQLPKEKEQNKTKVKKKKKEAHFFSLKAVWLIPLFCLTHFTKILYKIPCVCLQNTSREWGRAMSERKPALLRLSQSVHYILKQLVPQLAQFGISNYKCRHQNIRVVRVLFPFEWRIECKSKHWCMCTFIPLFACMCISSHTVCQYPWIVHPVFIQ